MRFRRRLNRRRRQRPERKIVGIVGALILAGALAVSALTLTGGEDPQPSPGVSSPVPGETSSSAGDGGDTPTDTNSPGRTAAPQGTPRSTTPGQGPATKPASPGQGPATKPGPSGAAPRPSVKPPPTLKPPRPPDKPDPGVTLKLPPLPIPLPPLVVKVEALKGEPEYEAKPYDRELFKYSGSKLRDEVLAEERLDDGTWVSKWDGAVYSTPKGTLQIDHNVALKEAWESGASLWSADKLEKFADDTENLNAITSSLNSAKGSDDGAWPAPLERCEYVNQVADIKEEYSLSVDAQERRVMIDVAENCKGVG